MIYQCIDDTGAFRVKDPLQYHLYMPLTNAHGSILSAISSNLAGDIKLDNDHFITPPASIEDIRSNLLCRREIFIRVGNTKILRLSEPAKDTLEAGFLYQTIVKKYPGLTATITNFVPHNARTELMRLSITNTGKKPLPIEVTSCIPLYGRSEKNIRDHRHVSSLLNRIKLSPYGVIVKPTMIFDEKGHTLNRTSYYVLGYANNGIRPAGFFPTLDSFVGTGSIIRPSAVYENTTPAAAWQHAFDGKEACGSLRFKTILLQPGACADFVFLIGATDTESRLPQLIKTWKTPKKVEHGLAETKKYWQGYLRTIDFNFGNRTDNTWLMWVKFQPTLRKLFGCSFLPHFDYGKGGRGWRDLWQDALTLLLTEPQKAGTLLRHNFKGIRLDGSNATIITHDGFLADRNKISRVWMDHGVWPWLATRLYLNHTADIRLLTEDTVYFCDHQRRRAKAYDSKFQHKEFLQYTPEGTVYTGSILEHLLVQNIVQFFNVGDHNVIRLENADWNDGLDMAADKGESVPFSFMYAHNILDICSFLKTLKSEVSTVTLAQEITLLFDRLSTPINYDSPAEKNQLLNRYFDSLETFSGKKIPIAIDALITDLQAKATHMFNWLRQHEWIQPGFFNGYYDNTGTRVEGKKGSKITMTLPAQVFAIMSGGAHTQHITQLFKNSITYLRSPQGGWRLNTDFGKPCMNLGRAFGFSYGDKENGAVFSHMAIMFAYALYQRGYVREGFMVFDSIRRMAQSCGAMLPGIPEYFNAQGKGLYCYLTGSASWYIYTLLEEMLGIHYDRGDLIIEPKLVREQFTHNTITTQCTIYGNRYTIEYRLTRTTHSLLRIASVDTNGLTAAISDTRIRIPRAALTQRRSSAHIRIQLA